MKIEKLEDDGTKSGEFNNHVNNNKHSNNKYSKASKIPKLYKLSNNSSSRSTNYGDRQNINVTARLRLLNYNSLLCDDIALPQRPERALLAPYYTYGCINDEQEYSKTFAICGNDTKLETKVKEEKGQNDDNDITLTTSECREKQCAKNKKRAVNKAKTASRKVKENKHHGNISNNESNNDIDNTKSMMFSLSSSDWLNTIPHVVIGRHSLLPPAYRVTFPFISRAHIKIVYVSTNKLHNYFINCYKRINSECHEYVLGSVKKEIPSLHTSPIEFTEQYYLLINYSDNMLYVNNNAIAKHTSIVLTEGDIISFLEKAEVTGSSDNDCIIESNAISENNKTCNYYYNDSGAIDDTVKKPIEELNTVYEVKCKVEQADNVDDIKSEIFSFANNVTAVKAEPVYIDVDDDINSIDSVVDFDHDSKNNDDDDDDDNSNNDNNMKEQNTVFQRIMNSNQCLHITPTAKYLLHWIDEHIKSNLIEFQTKTSSQMKIKTEIEMKKETTEQRSSIETITEFTNILANVLQLESTKMPSSSSSLESLHTSPIQSKLDINREAVLALLEILHKELQLIKSVVLIPEECQVSSENNELHNLQCSDCDALKVHTLSSLLRYMQLDNSNSDIEHTVTKLTEITQETYDRKIEQWQDHKSEMCDCLASLFTLVPAELPVFVFTCKQESNAWKHGDNGNNYQCDNNNHNNKKNGKCYIVNNKEPQYKDKYHENDKAEEQNNALDYILNKLHIHSCSSTVEKFKSVAADPFTPLSISHQESLQLPCAEELYKTSTLTPQEYYNNRCQQRTPAKNTSRNNVNSSSSYYYYYYDYSEEKEEEQEREKGWDVTNESMQKAVSSCKSEFVRCQRKAANKSYAVSETREGRSKYARHAYAHRTARNIEQPTKFNNSTHDKIITKNVNNIKESGYIIHDDDDDDVDMDKDSDNEKDDANSTSIEEFWKDETTDALFRPKRRRRRRPFR